LLAILVPEINISRTTTLEFQDFSRVFQDLCLFPGLSRVCKNPEKHAKHAQGGIGTKGMVAILMIILLAIHYRAKMI